MSDKERPGGWESMGASWRAEETSASTFESVDVEKLRARSAAFARTIRYRNVREVGAGIVVALAGVRIAWSASRALVVFGGGAMALAAMVVMAVVVLRARNLVAPPSDAPTSEALVYERAQLDRQARLLERVWLWYLAPFLPSLLAIYANALLRALEEGRGSALILPISLFLGTLLVLAFVWALNAREARRLRSMRKQMTLLREPS